MIQHSIPLVSVIIPAFNRADALCRAIQSCLCQTIQDLEIIVVDDGSTDATSSVVRNFHDRRVRLLRHPTNRGAAGARNTGILHAYGQFIAFLDSDDEWLPHKLEKQLRVFDTNDRADRLVCYCQILQHRGSSMYNVMPRRAKFDGEAFSDYTFQYGGCIHTITIVLRRSLARQCPFDERLTQHQDYDLCIQLEARGAVFEWVPEPLAIWHDVDQPNRLSRPATSASSWMWYDKHKANMSTASRLFFLARNIGAGSVATRPMHLLGLLVAVSRERPMRLRHSLRAIAYLFLGRTVVRRVKNLCLSMEQRVPRAIKNLKPQRRFR